MDQQFSLRWNNYLNQITDSFGSLRNTEDLVDVTLSCEGKKLKAHKMLLSACSTYFRDIFKDNPCQHPVIVFRNVKYADLEAIVDFMYKGEVNVIQEQLESFLGTAEMLEVKGLADGSGKESNFGEEESSTISKSQLESAAEPTPADRSAGGTREAPEVCPPKMDRNTKPSYLVSPLMKKRKYSASSHHGKTTEIKQRTLESEVSNLPIVPKIEQHEYIEDLTFEDEEEVYLGRPTKTEPLQTLLRNSKPDSPMEFNTSNNSGQNQPDSNMIEMGQMLLGEPGPSIESLGQEPMHAEEIDPMLEKEFDSYIESKRLAELETNRKVSTAIPQEEPNNAGATSTKLVDNTSNLGPKESKNKIYSMMSDNEMVKASIPHPGTQRNIKKSDLKPKEVYLSTGGTVLPVQQPRDQSSPENNVNVDHSLAAQSAEDYTAVRSEDAKTPLHDEPFNHQGHSNPQSEEIDGTSVIDQIQQDEPELAEEAPELDSQEITADEAEKEEQKEEEEKEPEFDYFGCETCKADAKPVDRLSFTHKCPVCPCECFCSHLLKEHMKVFHGWFQTQRRFKQY